MTVSMAGTMRLGEPASLQRTFGKGRVCAGDECGTLLSQYNPSRYCGVCDKQIVDTPRDCIGYVDSAPALAIIDDLTGRGATRRDIARAAGLNVDTIQKFMVTRPGRMRKTTADAVLAMDASKVVTMRYVEVDESLIAAIRAWREVGKSYSQLVTMSGVGDCTLRNILHGRCKRVSMDTASRIIERLAVAS